MASQDNFLTQYLEYIGDSESPTFYHRWCCLSMVATYLGRSYHLEHGHFNLNPNLYVMLIGPPGARKSSAVKIAKSIITSAGFSKFSAEKSSKEKFLLDLAGEETGDAQEHLDAILDQNLWGDSTNGSSEMYIACDEFNDFIGINNVEFISMLGSLWDYSGLYKNRIKSGKSVSINDPTINILGGNTPVNFIRAFPPDILGQGFFSRLLLIQGDPTGKRITFPVKPSKIATDNLVASLHRIKIAAVGKAILPAASLQLLEKVYTTYQGIDDIRFESYSQRRFTHLLKLCLTISACHYSNVILPEHIVEANTILTHTERLMPRALGEFGKSKNSDITQKVMSVLHNAYGVITISDIWVQVHQDLGKMAELGDILRNLVAAKRIVPAGAGFLAVRSVVEDTQGELLDYNYLTQEEKEMKI